MNDSRTLLSTVEVAAEFGIKPQTLAVWRMTGRYALPFIKCGRLIKYRRADIESWLNARTFQSCAEVKVAVSPELPRQRVSDMRAKSVAK